LAIFLQIMIFYRIFGFFQNIRHFFLISKIKMFLTPLFKQIARISKGFNKFLLS
jgi:hypothetical protein